MTGVWQADAACTDNACIDSTPMPFSVVRQCLHTNARISTLILNHATVTLPVFMPVATHGILKAKHGYDDQIILGNTFHLRDLGRDLHAFMQLKGALLTDSGGFQMISLRNTVTEEGVIFLDYDKTGKLINNRHTDNVDSASVDIANHYLLTPELSIGIQNILNSDIIMQLDDVVRPCSPKERHVLAVNRSVRWLDRCILSHRNDKQLLFGIVQGGTYDDLRMQSVDEIVKRKVGGIAIGGLCGGEDKKLFCDVVYNTVNYIRQRMNCPVYVMGVGYPEDVVVSIMLGSDMSDCVYPTRTARFGRLFSDYGDINIHSFKNDSIIRGTVVKDNAVYNDCQCMTCMSFSLNYLKMIRNTPNFCILMTEHNLYYMRHLTDRIKEGIMNDRLDVFIKEYMIKRYNGNVPDWIKYAYSLVNIKY